MKYLSIAQKEKLKALMDEKGLALMINQFLIENGLPELEVKKLHLRLKRETMSLEAVIPVCNHGFPMVEVCTIGGGCKWECNH